MWTVSSYRRLVRVSAIYDVFATAAFATPWSFAWLHAQLARLTAGWPGELPPFAPAHVLMANLLGSLVLVWAVIRIRDPQVQYGRYDAVARFLFAAWQAYALAHGVSAILIGFLLFELGFGLLQAWPVGSTGARHESHP
ncbi:MAG: hypothetical protein LBV61_04255 [Burkholderiaceae bacterium]|jgi:hypothetical protein|nr:hypothetical protein [Burkholderiaceae bacterium]